MRVLQSHRCKKGTGDVSVFSAEEAWAQWFQTRRPRSWRQVLREFAMTADAGLDVVGIQYLEASGGYRVVDL
jgi:hypothetical protein